MEVPSVPARAQLSAPEASPAAALGSAPKLTSSPVEAAPPILRTKSLTEAAAQQPTNAAAAADAVTSWVASLAVLPARQRLEWQRTITADVAAQKAAPRPGACSRVLAAYAGDGRLPRAPFPSAVDTRTLLAAERRAPGTGLPSLLEAMLAKSLAAAAAPQGAAAAAAAAARPSAVAEDRARQAAAVAARMREIGLDKAYGVLLARQFGLRLRADARFPGECGCAAEESTTATPHAEASCRFVHAGEAASGALLDKATRGFASATLASTADGAPPNPAAAAASVAAAPVAHSEAGTVAAARAASSVGDL
jgi:hypothetical protein